MEGRPSVGGRFAASDAIGGSPHLPTVRRELDRLLASPLLRNSKRCAPFLRYVVEETLEGRGGELKERRIAQDVFRRDASYEPSTDPIVRTTAIEVRKRLAQYYQGLGHEPEVRIALSSGHYAPEFHVSGAGSADQSLMESSPASEPLPGPTASLDEPVANREKHPRRRVFLWSIGAVAVLVAIGALLSDAFRREPIDVFWRPVWSAGDSVTLVLGDSLNPQPLSELPRDVENSRETRVSFADSTAQTQIAGLLQAHGRRHESRLAGSTTLADLRRGPAVLIGGLSNVWSMRLQDRLRFSIRWDEKRVWIEDRQKPDAVQYWISVDRDRGYSKNTVDYGIVARLTDANTQQPVVMVAGVGGGGTRVAADFVTQPKYFNALAVSVPVGWERKNLEIVLSVAMVNGIIGSPRIVAVHVW